MFLTTLLCAYSLAAPQELVPSGVAGETLKTRLEFKQLDNGLRHRHEVVPRGSHSCVLLAVRSGMNHDPVGQTGLARTLEFALRLSQPKGDPNLSLVVTTLGPATFASLTVPNREVPSVLRFYAELLSGELELSDDLLARAIAQARLRADDESAEIPGLVHYWAARRVLQAGDPRGRQGCGIADEMAKFSAATLRARFRSVFVPANAFLVTMGGLKQSSVEKLVEQSFGPLAKAGSKTEPQAVYKPMRAVIVAPEPAPLRVIENVRADAVFETAAIRASGYGEEDFVAFLLAMHLAKLGVARERWRFRGGEAQAAFTPFVFSMLENPGVVLINRRGENGGDPERPRQEIESVVARLREGVPRNDDVKQAVLALSRGLQLPPYDSQTTQLLATEPGVLRHPTFVVALYELWGWPTDLAPSIYQVKVRRIGEVLKERLASDQLQWFRTQPQRKVDSAKKER